MTAPRGPVPKRSTERRRRNKDAALETVAVEKPEIVPPQAPDGLHPIALEWFESLKDSGQSRFYEPSDWALAKYIATAMSKSLMQNQMSSVMFAAVMAAQTDLLTSEASRRRSRLEIQRLKAEEAAPPGISKMADFRKQLAK